MSILRVDPSELYVRIFDLGGGGLVFDPVSLEPGETARPHLVPLGQVGRLVTPLEQFKSTPWRQYWAVNQYTPEILYLGEFDSPLDARAELLKSGNLHTEEFTVVNCQVAAGLLISVKMLPQVPAE